MTDSCHPVLRLWNTALLAVVVACAVVVAPDPAAASTDEVLRAIRERAAAAAPNRRPVEVIVKLRTADTVSQPAAGVEMTQSDIDRARMSLANDLRGTGIDIDTVLQTLPYVGTAVNETQLMELIQSDAVDGVYLNRIERKAQVRVAPVATAVAATERQALATSVPSIDVLDAWAKGFDGEGYTVAVIDGGFNTGHPMLAGKVVGGACFSVNDPAFDTFTRCPSGTVPEFGVRAAANCPAGSDRCDHGTHIASTAVGNDGTNFGVARGARLLPIDVFSRVTAVADCDPDPAPCELTDSLSVLKALDYVNQMAAEFKIAAVNISIGGGPRDGTCNDDPRAEVIALLRKKGIATIVAAGNDGETGRVAAPACIEAAVAVGATNDSLTVATFGNFSPLVDLMAPGVAIRAASGQNSGFITQQGTSMAAPHVAGAFAVMREAFPIESVDILERALEATGARTTRLDSGIVVPKVQVNRAILRLQGRDRRLFNNVLTASANTDATADSFLRFHNDSTAPGTVTVALRDADTGRTLGTWTSPQIAAHASAQFSISNLEANAKAANTDTPVLSATARRFFNLEIESSFPGFMQHIVWARGVGALTNLSACADGLAQDNGVLLNVHTSALAEYPSRIRIANTGAVADRAQLDIYAASTGRQIGSWTSIEIPAGGSLEVPVSQIESGLTTLSDATRDGVSQVNVKLARLTGYLQHVIQNQRSGLLLDMSPKCDLGAR
ncbi:MAG: S8 family serine peptidase [Rhodospirillaceae bacterium]|nr:S8 family serine peptidase [Rhodospirillaceae bacterium]